MRIDEALNPSSERSSGGCTSRSACRPSYPAEFIVVRIGIWDGGGDSQRRLRRRSDAHLATRVDPYGNFNFLVEIDGITRAASTR